ncbi:long-chain acyl-CoA synthetase [Amycolatopsis marina]|uniref:Acyl-CoA synthetase n=1 Tax=Amycolatopsis marina TaxID=490629 RepID=A0A1I0WKR0_9PSEU|nr:AMP-dependent synthetase/ligase [Amycolatopsis marina]SFA89342.1 long-chain acyl-CoA synthetase [Amycolatopsis marina]
MTTARHPRTDEQVHAAVAGQTLPMLFARTVARRKDEVALRWRHEGRSSAWTWQEYADRATRVAALLARHAIGKGDTVALMLRNQSGFHAWDMGAQLAGATPFSVYNTSSPEQIAYLLGHAEARIVVADADLAPRVRDVRDQLPDLTEVIAVGGESDAAAVPRLDDLLGDVEPVDLARASTIVQPGDLATLIYTSGTTGPPKAVMLTQRNVCWVLESFAEVVGEAPPGSRMVSYLPMAHLLERLLTHYLPLRNGAQVHPCPDASELGRYLLSVRPEIFVAPPRIWEKLRATLRAGDIGSDRAAAAVGLDDCAVALVGAAPSPAGLIDFFRSAGLPLSEAYGLSETSGLLTAQTSRPRTGSVGLPAPGCAVRVLDDGEICCRGGNVFAGYYKDPDATAAVLDEQGWFRTGDVGVLDDDGYLTLVDRKKELIITAGGKNISPANLEAALKEIPLVGQACVIGDNRPCLVALLVLDVPAAEAWARRNGLAELSPQALAEHPGVLAEVRAGLAEVNGRLSQVERIKGFRLLGEEWLPDSDCLTPTMKLKRRGVHARYADEIDALYH